MHPYGHSGLMLIDVVLVWWQCSSSLASYTVCGLPLDISIFLFLSQAEEYPIVKQLLKETYKVKYK